MIDSEPSRAPTSPPDTGASTTRKGAISAAHSRTATGETVPMTTKTAPGSASPSALSQTDRTSPMSGSMVTMTSQPRAASAAVSAST
jgi:hypothetical protein